MGGFDMRIAAAVLLVALPALAGCATSPARLATSCYVVIEHKLPRAEICAGETQVRYHQYAGREIVTAVPPTVSAVLVAEGLMQSIAPVDEGGYTVYHVAPSAELDHGKAVRAVINTNSLTHD
jgi:hypothetical protein